MPTYYFDCETNVGTTVDDLGDDLPDADAAAREALLALGDAARDRARENFRGRMVIRVRDNEGPLMEVSATFEVSRIRR